MHSPRLNGNHQSEPTKHFKNVMRKTFFRTSESLAKLYSNLLYADIKFCSYTYLLTYTKLEGTSRFDVSPLII